MIAPSVTWPNQTGPIDPTVSMARQVPPVGMALDQLEKEMHYIRESLMQLEQRLGPALRPIPAREGIKGNTAGQIGNSPMASHIESLTHMARATGADVRAIIDCLEI